MQHPLASLGALLQEPSSDDPLDAQVAKTCTKWDVAQGVMDDVHAALQAIPLNNAEDLPRFQRTLVDYAAYAMYAALMKRQLDHETMPGCPTACGGEEWLSRWLMVSIALDREFVPVPSKKRGSHA